MMKSGRLFGAVLIFCILFISLGPCHAQQYSPAFQALLNQIQQTYLAPKGENIAALRSQYPAVIATLVGHALRQQMVHVQQNPSLNNQLMNLQREAQGYIGEVVRTTSARLDNGTRFTQQDLWNITNRAYQGQDDDWIWQNFRVQTGTMPSVLAASPGVQPSPPPVEYPSGKKEKNEINLLGRVAPPVKGPDSCDNVALYFSPQCKEYRQQKEAQAEAARQKSKALNPDGIQGTWFTHNGKTQLQIWKQGDEYLGIMSGESISLENIKRNEVGFRLKYAGGGSNGPIFKGQCLKDKALGFPSRWEWEDITFYYFHKLSDGTERLDTDESFYKGGMGSVGISFKKR
jgi:hypothetical protein